LWRIFPAKELAHNSVVLSYQQEHQEFAQDKVGFQSNTSVKDISKGSKAKPPPILAIIIQLWHVL
jgi:hypothetical protein